MQNIHGLRWALAAAVLFFVGNSYAVTYPESEANTRDPMANGYQVNDSRGEPLIDINGTPWRFETYKGRWIVVNYWASYCPPCLSMIPELNAIYRGREGKQAMVLGVNYDYVSTAETHAFVKEFNITYPVTQVDPASKLGLSPVGALPLTIIINPEGRVAQVLGGVQTQVSLENYMRTPEEQEGQ